MRILFFIDILLSGGKERRLTELMKALKKRDDCEFQLAVMSREIHYKEVLDLNIPIHYLIRKTKKDIFVSRKLYSLCRNFKPDIVHCWDSMTAVYSFPVCRILKIKLINGMITNSPENLSVFDKKWIRSRLTFPFSDMIIGNSKAGLAAYNAPENRSFYIHNGFDFKRTENLTESDAIRTQLGIKTRFVVGMVASYSKAKDYKTYFSAALQILGNRKDVTFLAIGSNTDSAEARGHISAEYSGYFRLLGRKTGIESFVNAMDIGVLATFNEGISNSILEYMALSKPVVATYGGGTNEIVSDMETGFLVSRSDSGELASKISLLLNDDLLRDRMGSAGLERIKQHFDIRNMADKYVALYNRLLSDSPDKALIKKEVSINEVLLND